MIRDWPAWSACAWGDNAGLSTGAGSSHTEFDRFCLLLFPLLSINGCYQRHKDRETREREAGAKRSVKGYVTSCVG